MECQLARPRASDARTLTFLGIVAGQVGCLFAQRGGGFARRLSPRGNAWILPSLAFELALAVALVYIPGVNALFEMSAVPPVWLLALPAGAAVFVLLDQAHRAALALLPRAAPPS